MNVLRTVAVGALSKFGESISDHVLSISKKLLSRITNKSPHKAAVIENAEQQPVDFDYGLRDSKNFRNSYGFNAPPKLRAAVHSSFERSRKIKRSFFKECQHFLDVDTRTGNLKVVYPKVEKVSFYFGSLVQIIIFTMFVASMIVMVYLHWIATIPGFTCLLLLIGTSPWVRPYKLARKIDNELKEIYQRK